MHSFCIPSSNATCAAVSAEDFCDAEKFGDEGAVGALSWEEGASWLGAEKKGDPIAVDGPDVLLGFKENGEGLSRPWGAEVDGIEVVDVWGFVGEKLKAEVFGEEGDGDGDIPKKVDWAGVGALAGRWIAEVGGNKDGPEIGTWGEFPNTLGDAIAGGFWELNSTGVFTLGFSTGADEVWKLIGVFTLFSTGAVEDFDAKNEVPLIVDDNGGVFGLLSVVNWLSDDSTFRGRVLKTDLGATASGWDDFVLSSSSSSCPGKTAFAKGELRAGLVLGRPSPIPESEGIRTLPVGEELESNNGFDTLAGVPGGVVLVSRAGDKLEDR